MKHYMKDGSEDRSIKKVTALMVTVVGSVELLVTGRRLQKFKASLLGLLILGLLSVDLAGCSSSMTRRAMLRLKA